MKKAKTPPMVFQCPHNQSTQVQSLETQQESHHLKALTVPSNILPQYSLFPKATCQTKRQGEFFLPQLGTWKLSLDTLGFTPWQPYPGLHRNSCAPPIWTNQTTDANAPDREQFNIRSLSCAAGLVWWVQDSKQLPYVILLQCGQPLKFPDQHSWSFVERAPPDS